MMLLLFHKIFPSERSWWTAAKRCILNDMQKMILDKAVDIEGRRLDSRRSISDVLCSMISPHRRYQLTLILNSQNVEFNIEIFWRKGFHCYFQASPNHHGWVAPFLSDPLGRQTTKTTLVVGTTTPYQSSNGKLPAHFKTTILGVAQSVLQIYLGLLPKALHRRLPPT